MKRIKKRQCQNGQAIIEYILILVVVVSLILGLGYQFNSAFRAYVTNYFGNYLACLLETGELPVLGANSGGGTCSAQFYRAYNPSDGQPLPGIGGGGSGGGNRNESRGSTTSTGSERGRDSRNPTPRSSAGGSGGGGGGGAVDSGNGMGGVRGTTASLINGRGRPRQTQVGEVTGESTEAPKALETIKGRANIVGQVDPESGRRARMTLDRRFIAEEEKEQLQKELPLKTRIAENESGSTLRPKVMNYEARKAAAKVVDIEDEGFSLGAFLRLLLVVLIVIALVLLIGGQAVQISKSWEKQ